MDIEEDENDRKRGLPPKADVAATSATKVKDKKTKKRKSKK